MPNSQIKLYKNEVKQKINKQYLELFFSFLLNILQFNTKLCLF